ncbi:intraflagellar transport protein 43 homolog A-like isoform X2 [Saccoglossus kowalevskii]|uniref:Intraflagellar transport protein 43 homolog A-like isoform X3 n=1 Tax=Saccoglossus kowalevskii TaxID=10224 RepID=A0ABM0MQ60_SACKO|nr:PREDICTED: intraflagellar transport protein 43 homolog A-like isoform X3 [Saccoglossus kowalevskii]
MADDDFDFTTKKNRPEAKLGRRARQIPQADTPNGDIAADGDDLASTGGPPKPSRRQGGWADDTPKSAKKGERLRPASPVRHDSDDDIPVIPDLEEFQEEDIATQIAAPPSVQVNRVATYRELDNDLLKHSQLLTLDGEIDLKLLTKVLAAESEVMEEDKPWDWDRLFTEVSSELQTEWEKSSSSPADKTL